MYTVVYTSHNKTICYAANSVGHTRGKRDSILIAILHIAWSKASLISPYIIMLVNCNMEGFFLVAVRLVSIVGCKSSCHCSLAAHSSG